MVGFTSVPVQLRAAWEDGERKIKDNLLWPTAGVSEMGSSLCLSSCSEFIFAYALLVISWPRTQEWSKNYCLKIICCGSSLLALWPTVQIHVKCKYLKFKRTPDTFLPSVPGCFHIISVAVWSLFPFKAKIKDTFILISQLLWCQTMSQGVWFMPPRREKVKNIHSCVYMFIHTN